MVDEVRSLRQACVQAVVISCSPRRGSIVKKFIATEENLQSASIIFSRTEPPSGDLNFQYKTLLFSVFCSIFQYKMMYASSKL